MTQQDAATRKRSSFRYVYIPTDPSEPIQQMSLAIPEGKEVECLLDHLKEHFGSEGMSAGQKEARKKALLAQLGDKAGQVDENMLNIAADMQMVENTCLLPNSRDAGYIGVNMYTDDQAQAKQLPFNPRASSIAECCGKLIQVRGDAFLARIYDDDNEFDRLDFELSEVASDAAWVKKAKQLASQREAQDKMVEMQAMLDNVDRRKAAAVTVAPASSKPKSEAELEKDAGNACVKRGDWAGAVGHYTRALELDPGLTAAVSNRALAHLKLQQYQQAIQDCDQVLGTEAGNVKALLRRAAACEGLGQAESAVQDYQKVLQLESVNKEAAAALDRLRPPPAPTTDTDMHPVDQGSDAITTA